MKGRILRIGAVVAVTMSLSIASSPAQAYLGPPFESYTVLAYNWNGIKEEFAVLSGRIWHQWYNSDGTCCAGEGYIPGWPGGGALGSPWAALNCSSQGKLHVFVVGNDSSLYASWQATAGAAPWTNWYSLGGILTSNPQAYRDSYGEIEIFARGGNNALYTRYQTTPCGNWSSWTSLGGDMISYPEIRSHGTGNQFLKIAVCGTDHREWFRERAGSGASWYPWYGSSTPC